MYISGKEVTTGTIQEIRPPHDHQHILATFHEGDKSHVEAAINAALAAKADWGKFTLGTTRSHIFKSCRSACRAVSRHYKRGYHAGQSKNAYQAEIDAACELIDFCASTCII